MSKNFVQSELVRDLYFFFNRAVARSQVWRQGPRVFINSLPKAGTHLLTSLMNATGKIDSAGRHLRTTDYDLNKTKTSFQLDVEGFQKEISRIRGGQYFSAHFPWSDHFVDVLLNNEIKAINLIRDPRDMIVSRYHYVMGLKRHHLNSFLSDNYANEEQRIFALINGPSSELASSCPTFIPYKIVLQRFSGWQTNQIALNVRYEDINGEKGGGITDCQVKVVSGLLDYVDLTYSDDDIVELLPKFLGVKTATMRKGISGAWKTSLSKKTHDLIETELSETLIQMGYK